ncbi:MAG TPA: glycerophosphodiester phosphodiesterase [bacterium]|nr:glycerophosphodiester phosphodiesterase [bacterium]HQL61382.1 glycerophosphodiester phosphodiesterase [bacterium]
MPKWFILIITHLSLGGICMYGHSVEIIGHRGASYDAPENRVVSVLTAWKQGADSAEIDIHLTQDNRIVLMHDNNTERITGQVHKIAETSSDVLRQLDAGGWKDPKFTGEKIPFLEEILSTIPKGRKLYIEIKCGPEILPHLKTTIEKSGKKQQIVIIGFDLDTVAKSKELMPNLPAYWLKATEKEKDTGVLIPHGKELIQTAREKGLDGLDVQHSGVTREFVDAVHEAGLRLYVWTVNDPDEARRLKELGVDGITTDRPGWLRGQLAEN